MTPRHWLACLSGLLLAATVSLAGATQPDNGEAFQVARAVMPSPGPAMENTLMPPEPGSARAQAMAALATAERVTLYSLQPWMMPEQASETDDAFERQVKHSERVWCRRGPPCLYRNQVLGKVALTRAPDRKAALDALSDSLGMVPQASSLCMPEYRHAMEFVSAGKRYLVLLCYECEQIQVVIDGDARRSGHEQAYTMGDQRALDAILQREGVPLAQRHEEDDEES